MKLSISNIAWSAEQDEEMYTFLQEVGFKGLEIAPTRIFTESPYDHLLQAKEWSTSLFDEFQLIISSMQSIWYGHSEKVFGSADERRTLIAYTQKAIDFAEAISCKNLVFGCPRNRDTADAQNILPIAIDFFREIGDYASNHHTVIALEANPTIYKTRFLNFTEQAADFADKVSSPGIKINVDLGTIIYNKEDINFLKQIPEFINHVHISEPGLNPIEKRNLHEQLFEILQDINYDKFISIEMGNRGDLAMIKDIVKHIRTISATYK